MLLSMVTPLLFAWLASMLANVFNWLYNLYLNRHLNLMEFAQISVLLNALILLSTLALSFQNAIIKYLPQLTSHSARSRQYFYSTIIWFTFLIGIIFTLVSLLTQPYWSQYFHLTLSTSTLLFSCLSLLGIALAAATRGFLYGKQAYYLVGMVLICESVLKLGFTLLAPVLGYAVFEPSLIAISLSLLIPYSLFLIPALRHVSVSFHLSRLWLTKLIRFSLASFLTSVSAQILLFTDLIIVQHYLPPATAGVYATLSLIGKMIFFLTSSIVALMSPEVAYKTAHQLKTSGLLIKSLLFTITLGLVTTLAFAFLPQFTLYLFLDPQKVILALPYLAQYGVTATLISLIVVLSAYLVFANYRYFLIVNGLAIIVQVTLLSLFHQTLSQIVTIMTLIASVSLVVISLISLFERRYSKNISASPGFKGSSASN